MTSTHTSVQAARVRPADTKPLIPVHVQYRRAERRIVAAYGRTEGADRAVALFKESVEDLRRLGLTGAGLIVAAEHMAGARLHQRTALRVHPKTLDSLPGKALQDVLS